MFYDTHTHTYHSCDSTKIPEDAVKSAIDKGLSGLSFTDHSDMRLFEKFDIPKHIPLSAKEADALAEKYKGQIEIFSGIEISDAASPVYGNRLKEALGFYDFDIVLASVHIVDTDGFECEFSSADFSDMQTHTVDRLLASYFEYMHRTVERYDFSSLCHVTYPLRYINGIYNKGATLDKHINKIEEIFKIIIDKKTALEINTAKCSKETPFAFCPEQDLLKLYISLGGKMFTLGSDSHIAGSEGRGFCEAREFLKDNGINECFYFKKKKPIAYKI